MGGGSVCIDEKDYPSLVHEFSFGHINLRCL